MEHNMLAIKQRHKDDRIINTFKNAHFRWTLETAVIIALKADWPVLSATDLKQIEFWNSQSCISSRRKLLLDLSSNHYRVTNKLKTHSPAVSNLNQFGKTAETSAFRKQNGKTKRKETMLGHSQYHHIEGVAIALLLNFFRTWIPTFDDCVEVTPVFDELEADFAVRKKKEFNSKWIPIQIKSANNLQIGKLTQYKLSHGAYPKMFCVCVGLSSCTYRVESDSPNDIRASDGTIAEIWNIGASSNLPTSVRHVFGTLFGTEYSKMPIHFRLQIPKASDDSMRLFAETLLHDMLIWPHKFCLDDINYDTSGLNGINESVNHMCRIEKAGFWIVEQALRQTGFCIKPVWRQNECVDYSIHNTSNLEQVVYVSAKTATLENKTQYGRFFATVRKNSVTRNVQLCDIVIANYSGSLHKVAVIPRETVYVPGRKRFCWNESIPTRMVNVRVFEDIRVPEQARNFVNYVMMFKGQSNDAFYK